MLGTGRRRGLALGALLLIAGVSCSSGPAASELPTTTTASAAATGRAACPTAPRAGDLPDAAALREQNTFLARLGNRPTGSAAHERYLAWIEARLRTIPGVVLAQQEFPIDRWQARASSLAIRTRGRWVSVPVAGPVPYSKTTTQAGATGPLTEIAADEPITAANARGRIVVRPAPAGTVPNSVFFQPLFSDFAYDPDHTIDPKSTFRGDFIAYNERVADLRAAAHAGAAGIVFVKELPRAQLVDHSEPYEGTQWGTPGVWLGTDEGKVLADALSSGGPVRGRITVRADVTPVVTRSIAATIPGQRNERIVIDSHTDGTNAVEDNGPVAMLGMARYLASLPMRCRPRTVELAFSTGHFYQHLTGTKVRDGGAEQLAGQLDMDYGTGTVSAVVVLEHLGALEYEQRPRAGHPGFELKPTGLPAMQQLFVTPSSPLRTLATDIVRRYDLRRTIVMHGADLAGATTPANCSFGGEGTPFEKHLLPTVALIAAPQSLYDPAFGVEAIDFDLMHRQTLAYTALVQRMALLPQRDVAGSVVAERAKRDAGAPGCPP